MEKNTQKTNRAIAQTKQNKRSPLNLTENQLKVIKDKYLKDSPSPEAWLDLIASNIALGDILHAKNISGKELFDGVNVKIVEKDIGEGQRTKMYLLHHSLETHNERAANFKKFLANLQKLTSDPRYKDQYEKTREEFYDLLSNFCFLPNSPTLMNAGRALQQLSACYVLPVEDSIEGIYESVKNMAIIHKSGGGTGFAFSKLRPANDAVNSTKGISSGPISFMQIFDKSTDVVKQGGTRRGANMGILLYNHPNIMDFINMKKTPGVMENFNVSVAITDEFMQKVKKGEDYDLINPRTQKPEGKLNARKVWDELVKGAWETGDPGIIIIDRINNTDSNPTPQIGQIESTNPCGEQPLLPYEPCFAPDTLITTKNGLETIENLYERQSRGEDIIIAADNRTIGEKGLIFRKALVSKTGYKEILEITLNNGQSLKVTPNHKIFTKNGWKRADELTGDDLVIMQNDPIYEINDLIRHEEDLLYGWLSGDGWFLEGNRPSTGICFGPDEISAQKELIPLFKKTFECEANSYIDRNDVIQIVTEKKSALEKLKSLGFKSGKAPKKEIPKYIFTAEPTRISNYLGGLFSADGEVSSYRRRIRLSSASPKLIKQAQMLLLNFGIISRISKNQVDKRTWYELAINGSSYNTFAKIIGFPISPLKQELMTNKLNKRIRTRNEQDFSKVRNIVSAGFSDVYDITEPKTHSLIANGIVVHNCNLGSINLSKFVDENKKDFDWPRLKDCVYKSVHFLDNVIDVNNYPIAKIEELAKGNRRIGLGVMGWAESLVSLGIPYNNEQAYQKARQLMKFINDRAREKSCELAKERGVFPNFKDSVFDKSSPNFRKGHDFKPRHCARTTIAPTGTIGITAGLQGAGIEPFFAVVYTRYNAAALDALKKGETPNEKDIFYEINPLFKKLAEKHNHFGLKPNELYQKIDQNHKSLVRIKQIPKKIQDLFLTSHDLTPADHVRMQAAFQEFTDNAVSKTVNFKNEATLKDVEDVYWLAYQLGCKGVTVYRDGSKSLQVLNTSTPKQQQNPSNSSQLTLNGKYVAPRQRPKVSVGTTEKLQTGQDNLYVTINEDENGLCEVFAHMGRSGGCTNAQTEALGRTISLALQSGVDPVQIAHQLRGIKCTCHAFFGKEPVLSIADGIGLAMEHYIARMKARLKGEFKFDAQNLQSPKDTNPKDFLINDEITECPECSYKLEYREGCLSCANCNYSKCG